jgi:hypothetical protein
LHLEDYKQLSNGYVSCIGMSVQSTVTAAGFPSRKSQTVCSNQYAY